jgi:ribosomal protein S12 methylthiotransferase
MMYLVKEAGHLVTGDTEDADIVVINTCGFIKSAKIEAIDVISEMIADKKSGKINKLIVVGCLPERYKDNILSELPEVDAFVGTGSFDEIVTVIDSILTEKCEEKEYEYKNGRKKAYFGNINSPVSETKRIITNSPYWTYLKIAEGCDNCCSYCCIPSIRGSFRSRPIENIINEAKTLVKSGFIELNLVAQDLSNYGIDLHGKSNLTKLVRELDKIEQLKWIRLLYLYPSSIDDSLIDEITKSDKIVKYLDIPIQHINDNVLTKMRRRYTSLEIKLLIRKLRERIPDVVLRTSVITGLPGESKKEFEELCEFLSNEKIERVGVFAYSPEEGTDAFLMKHSSYEVAIQRVEQIKNIQSKILDDFEQSRIGTTTQVLLDGTQDITAFSALINSEKSESQDLLVRSYAEAPEVDGYILVKNYHRRKESLFQKDSPVFPVRITEYKNNMLIGVRV